MQRLALLLASVGSLAIGCSSSPSDESAGNGGSAADSGGAKNGGEFGTGSTSSSGGAAAAGGRLPSDGGSLSGGQSSGGAAAGGALAIGGADPAGGAASGGGENGGTGAGGSENVGPLKVMAIGDSITQSTCWRALLWQALNESDPGKFDFVGSTLNDSGCTPTAYNKASQAYGGSLLTQAISGNFTNPSKTCSPKASSTGNCPALIDFTHAFDEFAPDIALLHYGTNDVWENKASSAIIDGYSKLVDGLRAANPRVTVLVAQIIPLSSSACSACGNTVPDLNAALADWAPTKSTADSPLVVVDQFTGFNATSDTKDGVHPNDAGSQKMAAQWLAALQSL
jgi:hypothetical protein